MLLEHAKDAKLVIDQSEVLFLACECNNLDAFELMRCCLSMAPMLINGGMSFGSTKHAFISPAEWDFWI